MLSVKLRHKQHSFRGKNMEHEERYHSYHQEKKNVILLFSPHAIPTSTAKGGKNIDTREKNIIFFPQLNIFTLASHQFRVWGKKLEKYDFSLSKRHRESEGNCMF